jgi:membrane protein involved in colicin uptake
MIAKDKYTDYLYNSLRQDYQDAKKIHDDLVALRQVVINAVGNTPAVQAHPINQEIAQAKALMDKAKKDFDEYANSDLYKMKLSSEQAAREFAEFQRKQEQNAQMLAEQIAQAEMKHSQELEALRASEKKKKTILYGVIALLGLGGLAIALRR